MTFGDTVEHLLCMKKKSYYTEEEIAEKRKLDACSHRHYGTCPTCQGAGQVNRDSNSQLVALIPLTDVRLKPRRVWHLILLTVLVCFLVGALLTLVLAPRTIHVSVGQNRFHPYNFTYLRDEHDNIVGLNLSFTDALLIQNENFFAVGLSNLSIDINRNTRIDEPNISLESGFSVGARASRMLSVCVSYTIYASDDDSDASDCIDGALNDLHILVTTRLVFATLWSNDQLVDLSAHQFVYCKNFASS